MRGRRRASARRGWRAGLGDVAGPRARRARRVRVGVATPARIRRASRRAGIDVRRWRLRHPAEAGVERDLAAMRRATPHEAGDLPNAARRGAGPTMRPRSPAAGPAPTIAQRGPRTDVRFPHLPPPGDVAVRAAIVALVLAHRLHPLHPRRPAVHPQRRRLRRRRRRDGHPARARRPLPLGRPHRPHRLRRDRDRRLGRSWARTTPPRTSPRPSRSR